MFILETTQWNHQDSNNGSCKHETPINPLDNASSICETWYTDTIEYSLNFWWLYWQTFVMGPLSITCGNTKSCSNVTTELYTCQKFGLEIDQGLQISYMFTHNQFNFLFVNIEHRWRRWQRCYLKSVKSLLRTWSWIFFFCRYAEC